MTADYPEAGQEVLVDTSCYGLRGLHWCRVTRTNEWSATSYPVKVQVPGRGEGQYKLNEIEAVR